MSSEHACSVCNHTFAGRRYLLRHLEAHRDLLTPTQLACLKQAASSQATETPSASAGAAAAPAPAPVAEPSADDAASQHFSCAGCHKAYAYRRAYETHLKKCPAAHAIAAIGTAATPVSDAAAAAGPSATPAEAPSPPLDDVFAEIREIAAILNFRQNPRTLLEKAPEGAMDASMSFAHYQSQNLESRLQAVLTLPPTTLPQLKSKDKLIDICVYQSMLESRAQSALLRQKIFRELFRRDELAEGECPFCRSLFTDGDQFMKHMHRCARTKQFTCEYCDASFANAMSKTRHAAECLIRKNIGNMKAKDPKKAIMELRNAETLLFWLLSETLANPDISLIGQYKEHLPALFREWKRLMAETPEEPTPTGI